MLAADKLQLQSAMKQQATALKEKEFSLHHNNLMTVGTQAAVLAGLDITLFVEFAPPSDTEWGPDLQWLARSLKMVYYGVIVAAFCANMIVVSHTTTLSVLGGGLALRGPDGSMMTATDALYEERASVFYVFGIGLACTVGSVLVCVWIMLHWEAALMCWLVALYTCLTIYKNYKRASYMLEYDDSETPDFTDILEGPASITALPTVLKGWALQRWKQKQQEKKKTQRRMNGGGGGNYRNMNGGGARNRRVPPGRSASTSDYSQDYNDYDHHEHDDEEDDDEDHEMSTLVIDSGSQAGSVGGNSQHSTHRKRRSPKPMQTV